MSKMDVLYLPEPNNLFAVSIVMTINGVSLPVVNINFLHATKHQLQFTFIKVLEPFQRNDLIETLQECFCLLLNASVSEQN